MDNHDILHDLWRGLINLVEILHEELLEPLVAGIYWMWVNLIQPGLAAVGSALTAIGGQLHFLLLCVVALFDGRKPHTVFGLRWQPDSASWVGWCRLVYASDTADAQRRALSAMASPAATDRPDVALAVLQGRHEGILLLDELILALRSIQSDACACSSDLPAPAHWLTSGELAKLARAAVKPLRGRYRRWGIAPGPQPQLVAVYTADGEEHTVPVPLVSV